MASGEVTRLLREVEAGSTDARDQLVRTLHEELRRVAGAQMRGQTPAHTLQPTALVHEAYLRLFADENPSFGDRRHFLAAAARAMRSVLVDMARAKSAQKRGGDRLRVTLYHDSAVAAAPDIDLVVVNEALVRLEALDPRWAEVVELRFFGGLTEPETAEALGVSEPTVYRAWERARTWLFRELGQ